MKVIMCLQVLSIAFVIRSLRDENMARALFHPTMNHLRFPAILLDTKNHRPCTKCLLPGNNRQRGNPVQLDRPTCICLYEMQCPTIKIWQRNILINFARLVHLFQWIHDFGQSTLIFRARSWKEDWSYMLFHI